MFLRDLFFVIGEAYNHWLCFFYPKSMFYPPRPRLLMQYYEVYHIIRALVCCCTTDCCRRIVILVPLHTRCCGCPSRSTTTAAPVLRHNCCCCCCCCCCRCCCCCCCCCCNNVVIVHHAARGKKKVNNIQRAKLEMLSASTRTPGLLASTRTTHVIRCFCERASYCITTTAGNFFVIYTTNKWLTEGDSVYDAWYIRRALLL